MKGIGAILGIVMLIIAIMVGMGFAVASLGALDQGISVSEDYQEQYDSTVMMSKGTLSLMGQLLPVVLVIVAVIAGLVMMTRVL